MPLKFLLLEDRPSDAELVIYELNRAGFDFEWMCVDNEADYLAKLNPDLDLILSDYTMPQFDAPRALKLLQDLNLDIPFIVATGTVSEEAVVACMKQGATDYLLKDRLARLGETVRQALEQRKVRHEREQALINLQENEMRLRLLAENMSDIVTLQDVNTGQFLYVSPSVELVLGYTVAEILTMEFGILIHSEDLERTWKNELRSILSSKRTGNITCRVRRKSGDYIWLETSIQPILDENRNVTGIVNSSREITERKLAEHALIEERNLLHTLIDNMPDYIYVKDVESRFIINNLAHLNSLGAKSQEEVLGKNDYDFFPRDLSQQYIADEQSVIQTGQPIIDREELVEHQTDGKTLWVSSTKVPLRDKEGKSTGLVGISRDVTQRKLAETELRQRAVQLALVDKIGSRIAAELELDNLLSQSTSLIQESFDYHHVALFFIEEKILRLKSITGAYKPYFKTAHTQKLSEGIMGLVASHGQKIVCNDVSTEPHYTSLIPEHTVTKAELCLPVKIANETIAVLDIQSPYLHTFGTDDVATLETITMQIASAIKNAWLYDQAQKEIADRKLAENALCESEERFRQVITSISDHIYMTEVLEDHTLVNRYISPNVEALTGYTRDKFITDWKFWSAIVIHPDDRGVARDQIARLLDGHNSEVEYRLVQANNEVIWVRDSARVQRLGPIITIYGVVSNVSERKKILNELEVERTSLVQRVEERTADLQMANVELARASRMKDEFLASMSHELRTPLNAILGMSETLHDGVFGDLNEQQRNSAQVIADSGHHLLDLINDILDLSKIEAGKLTLESRPVYIQQLCQASLQFVKQMAHKKRVKIIYNSADNIDMFHADERRMKQALVNLLTNAVKFTPESGSIGLEVIGDHGLQEVRFTVWDTGIGIADEDIPKLFRPFVQLDSKLSRKYEGTGLGLSLVYRLAQLHGGSISVKSEVEKGSRFTITLPWYMNEADDSQNAGDPNKNENTANSETPISNIDNGQATGRLILLAEDNEANIKTFSEYLRASGYRVIVAQDGSQAVTCARESYPDIILMDIQMPDMDGLETTQHIRSDPQLAHIPIIALTALAMPGDRERCLSVGMNEYLSKPIRLKSLVKTIEIQLKAVPKFKSSQKVVK